MDTEGDDVRDAGLPPEPGATGNAEVDAVLGRLARAAGNVGVYEDVHQSLRGILAALDPPPGPTPNRS
ncbi:hypothetical protein [Wenjunlia vitaminophila]|uniref:hypothetical protein n=1 Tax=Wenjunlia vitaminophila TaxID=76728 RepID=UPI000997D154|nr:hypothetical protein [Wenjunlia vitaminophila]